MVASNGYRSDAKGGYCRSSITNLVGQVRRRVVKYVRTLSLVPRSRARGGCGEALCARPSNDEVDGVMCFRVCLQAQGLKSEGQGEFRIVSSLGY